MPPAINNPAIDIVPIAGKFTVLDFNESKETIILKQVVKLLLQLIDRLYLFLQLKDYL